MKPATYAITVRGHLGDALAGEFDGLAARHCDEHTVLSGELADQPALFGVLDRIASLGLELIDVRRVTTAG